jgi:hypothetical protein
VSGADDKVNERRRGIVKLLAQLVTDLVKRSDSTAGEFVKATAGTLSTTGATVTKDLLAMAGGALPTPDLDPTLTVSKEQLVLAELVEKATTDLLVDEAQRKLGKGVLDRTVDASDAKCVQGILMGRRYFLQQVNATEVTVLRALLEEAKGEQAHGQRCGSESNLGKCDCWLSRAPGAKPIVAVQGPPLSVVESPF